ncbi:MAG TPA: S41 family peptidase [Thermoanaerobaculia bacterium]|jgi:C-terminal processing protease CtpA/Prc
MTMRRFLPLLLLVLCTLNTLPLIADDTSPTALYNEACRLALAGQPEEAFAKLQQAAEKGWSNADHAQKDSDLASLRNDPRWEPLMASLNARAAAEAKKWNNPTLVTPYRDDISEEEKIAGLSRVWSEVRFNFANFDLVPDVDWDALYLAAIPRVRATKSTLEYYQVLTELVAKLRDGHTGVAPPQDQWDRVWAMPPTRQQWVGGRMLFTDATPAAGVRAGDEILAIDGQPWLQYAASRVIPYLSASTSQDLENRIGFSLLAGQAGTKINVTVRDAKGAVSNVQLEREPRGKRTLAPRAPFELRMLPGNIAYVALNDFSTDAAADEYDRRFDEIAKASAIIIDLRRNGGGNTNVGYRVLSTLIDKRFQTTKAQKIVYRPTDRARSIAQGAEFEEGSISPDPKGRHYTKPVAVLIGAATYSAAEDFGVAWKLSKRGPAIGTATGGSTGQPLLIKLPGGGSFRICTKRDRFATGEEFVGVGIQPDIEVRTTVEDVQAGRDAVLERAIAEVTK